MNYFKYFHRLLVLIAIMSPSVSFPQDTEYTTSPGVEHEWKEGQVDESRSSDDMRDDASVSDEEWEEHQDDAKTDLEEEE